MPVGTLKGGVGERHHPHVRAPRQVTASQVEGPQDVHQRLLDVAAVARGVLGLDEGDDLLTGVDEGVEQAPQGEQVAALGVGLGQLGVAGAVRGPPRGPVEFLEKGQFQSRHHSAPVGGALDPAVVHTDEVVVSRQPHVALDPVGAVGERPVVRRQSVFGLLVARPSVRDDQRAAPPRFGLAQPL